MLLGWVEWKVHNTVETYAHFFLRCGLGCLLSSFFLQILSSPPPTHKGSAVFLNIGLTHTWWQGNAKLISKIKVFECLTLLKIEVIEYGKWASKWLEMHSQRHRFSFFSGEVQPPLSYSSPTRGLRQSVQNFGFQRPPPPPPPPPPPLTTPLGPALI